MNKIFLNIFLCLNIFSIINSECKFEKGKCTSDNSAKYPDLCCLFTKIDSDSTTQKNLLRGLDSTENPFCKTIPYSSYYEGYTREYLDNDLYSVDCSYSRKTYPLESCGNTYSGNPSKKECKKYSTYVDSCCYFSGKNKDDDPSFEGINYDKGCYWLGSKYEGSILWAGARLECSFKFLNYSLFTMLYLIISF